MGGSSPWRSNTIAYLFEFWLSGSHDDGARVCREVDAFGGGQVVKA